MKRLTWSKYTLIIFKLLTQNLEEITFAENLKWKLEYFWVFFLVFKSFALWNHYSYWKSGRTLYSGVFHWFWIFVFLFLAQNQVPLIINELGWVIYHFKAIAFSVVIWTTLKNPNFFLVSRKTGWKFLIFRLNSSEKRNWSGLQQL